ncbi:hypothetical protein BD779DRAFT_1476488 [Infundibulicybe gibba]|nr:hypothetical protein BD779DRAFT_1476488 [Infundibulicybe gibba]
MKPSLGPFHPPNADGDCNYMGWVFEVGLQALAEDSAATGLAIPTLALEAIVPPITHEHLGGLADSVSMLANCFARSGDQRVCHAQNAEWQASSQVLGLALVQLLHQPLF